MDVLTTLRDLMRTYRKSMGWSQEETARRWNYSADTISAWERGKRNPSTQEIPRLAHLLGMDAQELARVVHGRQAAVVSLGRTQSAGYAPQRYEAAFETWGELQSIFRNRTEFNERFSYPRMFEGTHNITAVGISLNAIALTYSRDRLISSILNDGVCYQLCFLDPDGQHGQEREAEENLVAGTIADLTRLNIRHMQLVKEQICKAAPDLCDHLQLTIYDLPPRYNIFMVDNLLMTTQSYGYGRGEDTPTLVLQRQVSGGLFDFYAAAVQYTLEHAYPINHADHSEPHDASDVKEMQQ